MAYCAGHANVFPIISDSKANSFRHYMYTPLGHNRGSKSEESAFQILKQGCNKRQVPRPTIERSKLMKAPHCGVNLSFRHQVPVRSGFVTWLVAFDYLIPLACQLGDKPVESRSSFDGLWQNASKPKSHPSCWSQMSGRKAQNISSLLLWWTSCHWHLSE